MRVAMSNRPVLALVPAWNEAAYVRPILEGTLAFLPTLVVDDGSTDDTAAIARAAGAIVINHPQNRGKGAALMTGFGWALEQGYEAVLTLDADGQHDPAEIPAFLAAYEAGIGELIIGRRDFRQMPIVRHFANSVGSWLLSLALGTRIRDNQSGYRLYARRLLERLQPTSTGFELEVEAVVQAIYAGMRIGWVDIRTIYGTGKASYFRPVQDSALFLRTVWRAYRQRVERRPVGGDHPG
jgi:glycosyltransferase involved in cell wall biosynthesis